MSASLHLAEAGHSVALLESHEPGWGASGRSGGQVIPGLKMDPDELNKWYGSDRGEALAELAGKAPDLVFELIRRDKIECDVRRTGWIQLAVGPKGLGEIKDRVGQWQRRGVDIEALDKDKVHALTGATGYVGGLIDRRGGNLNPPPIMTDRPGRKARSAKPRAASVSPKRLPPQSCSWPPTRPASLPATPCTSITAGTRKARPGFGDFARATRSIGTIDGGLSVVERCPTPCGK